MAQTVQIKRATAAAWAGLNPVLLAGEMGWDTTNKILKVGDGTTAWSTLPATSHAIADVVGLQTALDSKLDDTQAGAASGIATLDSNSKLTIGQLPAVAITETYQVANEAAMLATGALKGAIAIRADTNQTFILSAEPASTLGNWVELATPAEEIMSDHVGAADPHTQYARVDGTRPPPVYTHYGQRTVTNNVTGTAFTASADPTLFSNAGYIQLVGIWDAVPSGLNEGITQQTNSITVARTGVYEVAVWATITASASNINVAVKFAVDGVISLGRRPRAKVGSAGDRVNISGHGFVQLTAGAVVTLWAACDSTTTVTFEDMVFSLTEMKTIV